MLIDQFKPKTRVGLVLKKRSALFLAAVILSLPIALHAQGQTTSSLPMLGDGSDMSSSAERRLGDRIVRELYRDPDFIDDPVLSDYVQGVWQPLLGAARVRGELTPELDERFAWRIVLGRDRSVNAFALPGGYLGLHLGLLAVVSSRDELASVLGHELSHVTQRHISRLMSKNSQQTPWVIGAMILGALAASKNAEAGNALIVGGQALSAQSQLNFSRDMEREADRVGFGVLNGAGFDPTGFVTMFDKLQQAARHNDDGSFPYLRSHPLTTERIADMQARLQLNTGVTRKTQDIEQAMLAARARVLSQNNVDALRAATNTSTAALPQATTANKVGIGYAATLAHMQLRDFAAAERGLQNLDRLVNGQPAAMRLARLLRAELAAAQGRFETVTPLLASPNGRALLRPELMATAQALIRLPDSSARAEVLQQMREQVQAYPLDAQAWNSLGNLWAAQGQTLQSLRAEGEAQMARMDWQGAIDRFRAAQDWAKTHSLQAGDHVEASIVDTRLRNAQALMREMQTER